MPNVMPASSTRECIAENFLSCTIGGSDKGYVLRIYKDGPTQYYFYTNYGPRSVGMIRNSAPPRSFNNLAAVEREYNRKIVTELGKGYVECTPEFIGCRREMGTPAEGITTPPAVVTPAPSIWTPMLFTTANLPAQSDNGNNDHILSAAEQFCNNPEYVFQRKYDGERMRVAVLDSRGVPFCCNRRGIRSDVNMELRVATARLFQSLGRQEFDFDGERIGTNSYVIWDNMINESVPYEERFRSILSMATSLPEQFTIAETAFQPATKRAMLRRALSDGWEGIVIKKRYSPYLHGRSSNDFKFPFLATVTVRLTRVNPTTTTQYGSVSTEIRTGPTTTVPGGNVAGGFSGRMLEDLANDLQNGATVLADIRYKNWTGQALYQPKFERYREDLTWSACTVTQLRGASQALVPVTVGG
jgi:hypothetical protein